MTSLTDLFEKQRHKHGSRAPPITLTVHTAPSDGDGSGILNGGVSGGRKRKHSTESVSESAGLTSEQREVASLINEMDAHLETQCQLVRREYQCAEQEQFMITFDPDEQATEAVAFLTRFGFVCLRDAVSKEKRDRLRVRVDAWLRSLGTGMDPGQWDTFINERMPDNYTTGVLDGVAPPNPTESAVPSHVAAYETMMALASTSNQQEAGKEEAVEVKTEESSTTEFVHPVGHSFYDDDGDGDNDGNGEKPVRLHCGITARGSVPHRQQMVDMRAIGESDSATERYVSDTPIYNVAREAPGLKDDLAVETRAVRDLRCRFDTLTHAQEAWDVRTDARLYRFFRRILNAGDDLLVSIDRFIYQRPLRGRPHNTPENWNNFERRPTWEQNPYWSSDPLCTPRQPKNDGSYMMLQKKKRQRRKRTDTTTALQSSNIKKPSFTGYQGILALEDLTSDGGAPFIVPGFHNVYTAYAQGHAQEWSKVMNNLVRAREDDPLAEALIMSKSVQIAMRRGTMLVYDKRVPRWGSLNARADVPAVAMFITMWPREPAFDAAYRRMRALSVRYGLRCTAMQHLMGHVATPPRWKRSVPRTIYKNYQMPLFTELGLCLLGVRRYTGAIVQSATGSVME